MNFVKLEKALDFNGNGILQQDEFVKLVNDAKQSSISTADYSRISGASKPEPQKSDVKNLTLVDMVK
jgi:hypothetical protein